MCFQFFSFTRIASLHFLFTFYHCQHLQFLVHSWTCPSTALLIHVFKSSAVQNLQAYLVKFLFNAGVHFLLFIREIQCHFSRKSLVTVLFLVSIQLMFWFHSLIINWSLRSRQSISRVLTFVFLSSHLYLLLYSLSLVLSLLAPFLGLWSSH